MTLKLADFDPILRQVVPSPFLRRILLLGSGHANGTAKSSQLYGFRHNPLEVLLPTYTRFVYSFVQSILCLSPTVEEMALVQFFGNDYEVYRRRVGTWIPFIP